MNGDFLGETDAPSGGGGGSNAWLDRVLNTGLGVAGLFSKKTPGGTKTGTTGAPNWMMIGIVAGAVVLLIVLVIAGRGK